MRDSQLRYNPPTRTCEYCGKEFILHDPKSYVYKHNPLKGVSSVLTFFCSWRCMRAWEKYWDWEKKVDDSY